MFEGDKAPVISVLMGRLGNCMFQAAAGKSYAEKMGRDFYVAFFDYKAFNSENAIILSRFNWTIDIPDDRADIRENPNRQYYPIPDFHDELAVVLFGYYQDERYFKREDVLEWYKSPYGMNQHIISKYGDITDCVHISVRRGDYVDNGIALGAEWYNEAYFQHFNGQRAVICSDDIEWCKHNLKIPGAIFSDHESAMEDMYTGALCKDHICYNGSFGWWSSYLGERPDSKIVIKDGYFKSLPEKWIPF